MSAALQEFDEYIPKHKPKARTKRKGREMRGLCKDDVFIVTTLEKLQKALENAHHALDNVTDPDLIDSYVFELNAINMRYKVYLQMSKERGIVSAMFK